MTQEELPLTEHLEALRWSLIRALIGIAIGFGVCYYFAEQIMVYLQDPLFQALPPEQQRLYFTHPLEKFMTYLKIGIVGGLVLAAPWVLYQVWSFIGPGLYPKEKRLALPLIFGGSLLFYSGMAFSYFLVIPAALAFLIKLGGSLDGAIITYSAYMNVLLMMMVVFGLIFQIPLIMTLAVRVGFLTVQRIKDSRPYAYVAMAIIAAILTPPDVFTMLCMFLPMVALFEITLVVLSWKK